MSYILAVNPDIFSAIEENPMPGGAVTKTMVPR